MSKQSGYLYHPSNNYPEKIYTGFSWPCLFFGFFWFVYKNMWAYAVISFLAAFLSWGISNLIFPFLANNAHQTSLLKKGYLGSKKDE